MDNQDFQKLVLEKFEKIDHRLSKLETDIAYIKGKTDQRVIGTNLWAVIITAAVAIAAFVKSFFG